MMGDGHRFDWPTVFPQRQASGFHRATLEAIGVSLVKNGALVAPIPATFVVGTDDEVKAALSIPIIAGGWRSRI